MLLVASIACAPRGPVIDTGAKPPGVGGTISGTVRGPAGSTPLSGRKVTATNIASGATFDTSTAVNGGYTMKVPVGKYRLDVELRTGEVLDKRPDDLEINTSDIDAQRNFVITVRPG